MHLSPRRIDAAALAVLMSPDTERFLSIASCWEIALKHAKGKLPLPAPPAEYLPERLEASAVSLLAIGLDHILRVADLPAHHSDPFDRLIVCQAMAEDLAMVTHDRKLHVYGARIVHA